MLDTDKVINNKNEAINSITRYLDECIIQDSSHQKKANLLSYWLKDYIKYIRDEEDFDCSHLKQYNRGDVIKVNLAFNIGNEEGGLHYCVVLDKKNSQTYSTLTVVPLTSLKTDSKIHKTSVPIGNEIYQNLDLKNKKLLEDADKQLKLFQLELNKINSMSESTEEESIIKKFKINQITSKIENEYQKMDLISKINHELSQMKNGTIALINQITTISKQRIYNPKKDLDILSGISISNEKMKLIDEKIKKLYLN